MIRVQGTVIHSGLSIGPIHFLHRDNPLPPRAALTSPDRELNRFEAARNRAKKELGMLQARAAAKLGNNEAAIFLFQAMMLEDEDYLTSIRGYIEDDYTAEHAVSQVEKELVSFLSSLDNSYLSTRTVDARDLSRRLQGILTKGFASAPIPPDAAILVSDEVTPSETTLLWDGKLLGLVSRTGSPDSHTAILARAMGVPALTDVAVDPAWDGRFAVLDADNGILTIDPDLDTLRSIRLRARQWFRDFASQEPRVPARPRFGGCVRLTAPASTPGEAARAIAQGAHGVGLYSLADNSEDALVEECQSVVEYAAGRPVTFRTVSAGRFPTSSPILHTQLRALLRSAQSFGLRLVLPGIESLQDLHKTHRLLEGCRRELSEEGMHWGPVALGVLLSSPSAVLNAERLAAETDFIVLDGHSLLLSTATGKEDTHPDLPTVLWIFRRAAIAAKRFDCKVALLGNLARFPRALQPVLDAGVDEIIAPLNTLPDLFRFIQTSESDFSSR